MPKDFSHRVVAIVGNGSNPFEVAVATEFFGINRPEVGPWYDYTLCAPGGTARMRDGLFDMTNLADIDAARTADTVIVPNRPDTDTDQDPVVLQSIRDAHRRGARLVSFCTGAYTLAAAGVLEHRKACTHWMWTDDFGRRFPSVRLHADVLFVADGNLFTAAGSAAAVDLCLHLVRLDHGSEIANLVARRLVYPGNRDGGQQQFMTRPVPRTRDESLAPVLDWALARIGSALDVPALAAQAGVSVPTLHRRFRAELGCTPLQWITAQRIDVACGLLETTTMTVDAVAAASGFGTAANLRIQLRSNVGISPSTYRQRFRRVSRRLPPGKLVELVNVSDESVDTRNDQ